MATFEDGKQAVAKTISRSLIDKLLIAFTNLLS